MRENDTAAIRVTDLPVALALMTRLPMPVLPDSAFERQARATWAFPIVGLLVGLCAAAVAAAALALGLAPAIAAGLALTAQMLCTGALHEDGLADCADGFWGGATPEHRLDIMKDSRIGSYGVLALFLSLGLRWSALSIILPWAVSPLIVVAVASRAGLPFMMHLMPRVRPGGLSDRVGQPPAVSAVLAAGIGVVLVACFAGATTALLVLTTVLSVVVCAALARAKIGGQTGDVLGATQLVAETAGLILVAGIASAAA